MKFRQSSGIYMVLGIFLSLICSLHTVQRSSAVDAVGPDWLSGAITTDNFQTIVPTSEWQTVISSGQPQECITAKYWTAFVSYYGVGVPYDQDKRSCAVPMATGYMADHAYVAYGDKYWQFLEYNRDESIVPVPGKSSAMIVDSSYPFTKLRYVSDLLGMYSKFTKDSVGNVIRWKSSDAYDFTLKKSDGQAVNVEGPLTFSANGRWSYLSTVGKSRILFDVETKQTLAFAPYQQPYYARPVSVSNSGRFVAVSMRYDGLYVYDTTRCEAEKPDFESRNCGKRNIETDVREAYIHTMTNPDAFASFTVVALQFKNESTLTITAVVTMRDGTGQNVSVDVHVDPGPQTTRYLAMGDSFSSGEGVGNYYEATNYTADAGYLNECHQSRVAYSELLNKALSPDWYDSVACSGAQVKDVNYIGRDGDKGYIRDGEPQAKAPNEDSNFIQSVKSSLNPGYIPQLSLLKSNPSTVSTITIGGNDIGFGDIVTACVWQVGCYSSRNDREHIADLVKRQIPRLVNTYKTIKQNMSGSDPRLYVVGYPRIFNLDNPCVSFMGRGEREFANSLVDYLNAAIKIAANEANVRYIDVSDAFIDYQSGQDYRLCGNAAQALNGLTIDMKNSSDAQKLQQYLTSSYHPNALGHTLLAKRIRSYTNDFRLTMPSTTVSVDGPSVDLYRQLVGDAEDRLADVTQINLDVVDGSVFEKGDSLRVSFNPDPQDVPISGNSITVELHSEPVTLAMLTVGSDGTASADIALPSDITPGPHEIHLLYTDMTGQKHDVYKHIYVIGSMTDFDGDGIPNDKESCVIGGTLSEDRDHDGIDDACDSEIVEKEKIVVTQETIDNKADDKSISESQKDTLQSDTEKTVNNPNYGLELKLFASYNLDHAISNNPTQIQQLSNLTSSQTMFRAQGVSTGTLGLLSNTNIEGTPNTLEDNSKLPVSTTETIKTEPPEPKDQTKRASSLPLQIGAGLLILLVLTVLVLKHKRIPKKGHER